MGTQEDRKTEERKYSAKYKAVDMMKSTYLKVKYDRERRKVAKFLNPHCQEKPL